MSSILFVCLGNICRSPLAQGIFEKRAAALGWRADSAGTGDWHAGDAPDPRSVVAAQKAGYDISSQRARQIRREDFDRFTHIRVMDADNLANVMRVAPSPSKADIAMLMVQDVPDPYYGSAADFDAVVRQLEQGIDQFVASLKG